MSEKSDELKGSYKDININQAHKTMNNSNFRKQRKGWKNVHFVKNPIEVSNSKSEFITQTPSKLPDKIQGYINKKRTLPNLGWHYQFFYIDDGNLYHTKTILKMATREFLSKVNLKFAVISYNEQRRRINIDTKLRVYRFRFAVEYAFLRWLNILISHQAFANALDLENALFDEWVNYDYKTAEINDFPAEPDILNDESLPMSIRREKVCMTKIFEMERGLLDQHPDYFNLVPQDDAQVANNVNVGTKVETHKTETLPQKYNSNSEDSDDETYSFVDSRGKKDAYSSKRRFIRSCKISLRDMILTHSKDPADGPKLSSYISTDEDSENSEIDNTGIREMRCSIRRNTSVKEEVLKKIQSTKNSFGRRTILPYEKSAELNPEKFSMLDELESEYMHKMELPVKICEPLSVLQQLCEDMEYSDVLTKASEEECCEKRMGYVAAFAVSTYEHYKRRCQLVPFMPLLYETFECERKEKGWKFVAEQVSLDPPIAVCHCEHKEWILEQELQLDRNFRGFLMPQCPYGGYRLTLKKNKEKYTWSKLWSYITKEGEKSPIRKLHLSGSSKMSCKESGTWCIQNATSTNTIDCKVFGEKDLNLMECDVGVHYFGRYGQDIFLWNSNVLQANAKNYYGFSQFAIELNEEPDSDLIQKGGMPITDSRLRPDQRLVEYGDFDLAQKHSECLHKCQRLRLRNMPELKHGAWFKKIDDEKQRDNITYSFNNEYWHAKEHSLFRRKNLPDIFNVDGKDLRLQKHSL